MSRFFFRYAFGRGMQCTSYSSSELRRGTLRLVPEEFKLVSALAKVGHAQVRIYGLESGKSVFGFIDLRYVKLTSLLHARLQLRRLPFQNTNSTLSYNVHIYRGTDSTLCGVGNIECRKCDRNTGQVVELTYNCEFL